MCDELTEDHYKKFCEFSKKWKEFLGLNNWNIHIHFDDTENEDGYLAYTSTVPDNHRADIYLVSDWGSTEPTDKELSDVAFHEMCEVLLFRTRYLAEKRHIRRGEVDSEIHGVIRVLESVVLRKLGVTMIDINETGQEEWD